MRLFSGLSLAALCCLCWWAVLGGLTPGTSLHPVSWAVVSCCIWLAYLVLRPDPSLADKRQALWGCWSSAMLLCFLAQDPDFRSWGDVYFFCGSRMQYCTCSHRLNLAGWNKALVLWNFVLTTALGFQRMIVQLVLQGLLPGEEVVTRESFISICWRLIPYWLNNWEQQWGAECSSMMFELPQFAGELLIILPCVQILCSRMKVLAMPSVNVALPAGWDGVSPEAVREAFVPNVLRGCWERRPEQKQFWQRMKANKRVIAFTCLLCLMTAMNALVVPLHLEDTVLAHPDAAAMQAAGRLPRDWATAQDLAAVHQGLQNSSLALSNSFLARYAMRLGAAGRRRRAGVASASLTQLAAAAAADTAADAVSGTKDGLSYNAAAAAAAGGKVAQGSLGAWQAAVEAGPWQHNATWGAHAVGRLMDRLEAYQAELNGCVDVGRFKRNVLKHHEDIFRMRDPEHRATIPLVEVALALMRLSTEKFFVLVSLYVAFLVFRTPPRYAAALISLNARVSSAFARLILYSFPVVCWVYGAGFVFSTLVSVVFWGGPLSQLYNSIRGACSVSVKGLRPATAAEIERMHGDCAICWCEMTVPQAAQAATRQHNSNSSSQEGQPGAVASATEQLGGLVAVPDAVEAPAGAEAYSDDELQTGAATQLQPAIAAEPDSSVAGGLVLASDDGSTLPCGHCYHQACLTQWLQQCHSQGTSPTCPMCQARMQLVVKWQIWRALLPGGGPAAAGGLGARQWPAGGAAGLQDAVGVGADGAAVAVPLVNNYLLVHNPRLAEMLADMPQFLAQENVQLLAEVQDLRAQRQQLVGELQLRQQQLHELVGRHQQLELEGLAMEQQRQQLLRELELLRRARQRQLQLLEQQQPQQQLQQQQEDLAAPVAAAAAAVAAAPAAAADSWSLSGQADMQAGVHAQQDPHMRQSGVLLNETMPGQGAAGISTAATAAVPQAATTNGEHVLHAGTGEASRSSLADMQPSDQLDLAAVCGSSAAIEAEGTSTVSAQAGVDHMIMPHPQGTQPPEQQQPPPRLHFRWRPARPMRE